MLPDFNRLRVFYHIYNQQSSTAAAKTLNISQSGVSQHLKKLEDELQQSLFTRVNRRLVPTSAGHELYSIVQGFILNLEDGVKSLGTARNTPSGLLRIGAPSELGNTYLPKIMARFNQMYSDVTFQLELRDPPSLFTMVSQGELDFAYIDILPIYLNTPDTLRTYSIEPLVQEEFIMICSRVYYEKQVKRVSYEELVNQQFISYKKDIALFQSWFHLHFDQEPQSLRLALIADSARAIISALEEGLGMGMIVSHLITNQLEEGSLIPLEPKRKRLKNTIACVRLKDKEVTLTEQFFQKHCSDALKECTNIMTIES